MRQEQESTTPARRWRFGGVELDERSLALTIDGGAVEIEPKPLLVLQHLLDRAGEVVTKDALIRAVWPGRIVTDDALCKSMARLREAIQDKDQTLIKTHHGFGYRLVAPIKVEVFKRSAPASPTPQVPIAGEDPPATVGDAPTRTEAERRLLTVLFCDLVGSTQLAESLDAEEFRALLLDYQHRAADLCTRYEGHVAQKLGDGLLLYFGYPAAHDDDAERALRCAWDLRVALARLDDDDATKLSVRIGVHTGSVVIGRSGPGSEVLATGPSLHLAARLQTLAEPDTILCSDSTFRLVPGLFITRDCGPQVLRGLSEPVRVHQVLHPSGVRTRLEAAARLTPFAGREREIGVIESAWRKAVDGRGQAVLISGEPGLGKSRLLLELRERLSSSAYTWLECRAAALSRHSAYQPIVELLQRGLAINPTDTDEQKLQRLEQGLDTLNLDKAETIPLLAPLLTLALPSQYPASQLGPELRRRRTLEALAGWVQKLAHEQPLVIVFEDLHWADDSSIEVLTLLLKQLVNQPILLLMTARTEFVPRWPANSHLSTQVLEPLPRDDVEQMLVSLTPDTPLSEPLKALIRERAGGVPLFVEELTRTLLESGQLSEREGQLALDVPIHQLAIPESLQGLLMARLDRLGPARELIQTAAAIGRETSYLLIERVSGIDNASLRRQLQQLNDAGLLHVRGAPPDASYVFKHALIQDAAYDTLLKARRQALHGAIATALEAHFPERAQNEPAVLAAHFEQARLIEPAVRYYKRAAEKAIAATSLQEAITRAEHALRLLPQLPESPQRNHLELDLSLTLGNCRTATLGYGHVEVERTFSRARELCEKTQDPALLGRALANIWLMQHCRGEFVPAIELAEQLITLGRKIADDAIQLLGLGERGWTLMNLGRLAESLDSCQRALSLLTPEVNAAYLRMLGHAYTAGLIPMVNVQWLQGHPDRALETARLLVEKARQANHPPSLAQAQSQAMAHVLLFRREPQPLMELGPAAIDLAERHGFVGWLEFAQLHLGLAYCMLGRLDEGLPMVRAANAAKRSSRTVINYSMYAVLEAEQCRLFGRYPEAQAALTSGFAFMEQTNERFWEAELHRVKGELALAVGCAARTDSLDGAHSAPYEEEAEACFHKALEVARSQGAKSLELRAATSRARLWQRQTRQREAFALLQPVYAWFTEGFDTPDLLEAKTLLLALDQN